MNQKGGVGKTTTTANLGAALALQGRRVVLVDMDAQANLSLSLDVEVAQGAPSSYTVLIGGTTFEQALRPTRIPNLRIVASHLDLSGAELELASTIGREFVMRDALRQWIESSPGEPADYVLFDCPPSLGLLSINALAASQEVLITLQTEFLALQGMSKLIEVVQLLRRRLNPELSIAGILPCLYDSRLKLAREVLGEIRAFFPGQVLPKPVRTSVKLAEAPSYGRTIFEYAPESHGAQDYMQLAREIIGRESRDPALAQLPPFDETIRGLPPPHTEVAAPAARPAVATKDATPEIAAATVKPKAAKRERLPIREIPPPPTPKPTTAEKPAKAPRASKSAAKPPVPTKDASAQRASAAPAPATHSRKSVSERVAPARSVSADDFPPLPPDAFEILSSFGRES